MKRVRTENERGDIDIIRGNWDETTKKIKETVDAVDQKINELKTLEAAWEKKCEEMKANAGKANSKIVFDVGGQRFATTKETLLRQPDTYFTAMLNSGQWRVRPL